MDVSIAYMAGFFDGEGSVGIYGGGGTSGRTVRVQVTQNVHPASTALLDCGRSKWGGSMTVMNRSGKRQAWNWQVNGAAAIAMLRDLRPFLLLKAEQVDLTFEWWEGRSLKARDARGRMLAMPQSTLDRDEQYASALKRLKKE